MNLLTCKLFDNHLHTEHSHDSRAPMEKMIQAAIAQGLGGVAITEHCDMEHYHIIPVFEPTRASFRQATELREKYKNELKVFTGVEICETIWEPEASNAFLRELPFDVIVGSIHAVRFAGETIPYSHIDFRTWTHDRMTAYLHQYFADMIEMLHTTEFDILAHLTCPLRYMMRQTDYSFDFDEYRGEIREILSALIQKGIALEVNTSSYRYGLPMAMPDGDVLRMYRSMGGDRISLASDAHVPEDVGVPFDRAVELLCECGFTHTVYFENRVCHFVSITQTED